MKKLCLLLLLIIPLLLACQPRKLHGATPLITAAMNGNITTLKKLVGHTLIAKPDSSGKAALMYAIIHQHFVVVKYLVAHGADVNLRNSVNGNSTLMYAAATGNTEIVKYLLSKGAHVYFRNLNRDTALIAAAGSGNRDSAKLLLKHGAHFNRCNRQRRNAYATAIYWSQSGTARRLATYAKKHRIKLRHCDYDHYA